MILINEAYIKLFGEKLRGLSLHDMIRAGAEGNGPIADLFRDVLMPALMVEDETCTVDPTERLYLDPASVGSNVNDIPERLRPTIQKPRDRMAKGTEEG